MSTSRIQLLIANEILENSKLALYSLIASLALYSFLFFYNKPDYYTSDEINQRKQYEYQNSIKKHSFQPKNNEFNQELGIDDSQSMDYATSYSSRKSKYFDCSITNAQMDEEARNEQAKSCFLNDIRDSSIKLFFTIIAFLITLRYIFIIYRWANNTVNK